MPFLQRAGLKQFYIFVVQTHVMETNIPDPNTLQECQAKLAAVERAFAQAEQRTQKSHARQVQLESYVKQLQNEKSELLSDYESLRLQKGGFGIKSLTAACFMAFLSGVLCCYIVIRLRNPDPSAFRHFQHKHQFNLELMLNNRQYDQAIEALQRSRHEPEFRLLKPQIEMLEKVVAASKNGCIKG